MPIAVAEYTMNDINDIWPSPVPPTEIPPVGFMWRNTNVSPNEFLAWTGYGIMTDRRYERSRTDGALQIRDLSDIRTLRYVALNRTAVQSGSGTPSLTNIRPFEKKTVFSIWNRRKNLLDITTATVTKNGVTLTYDPTTQTITLNGTCTTDNTWFPFDAYPTQVRLPHILSAEYVSGSITPVGLNRAQIGTNGWTESRAASLPSSGKTSSSVGTSWIAYPNAGIRVDAGSVFVGYRFRVQLEFGNAATDWDPYVGKAFTIAAPEPVFGITGYEDEIRLNRDSKLYRVVRNSKFFEFDGSESAGLYANLTNCSRFYINVNANAVVGDLDAIICSHAPYASPGSDVLSVSLRADVTPARVQLTVPNSVATTVAGLKSWLAAQKAAGTPVQVVLGLAAAEYTTIPAVEIDGYDRYTTISSDADTITVSYTGSGWETVGAVERLDVESVSISKEQGLRVDTILSDGTSTVPVYFSARGTQVGLYRTSDNKQLWGGKLLPDGRVVSVAGALVDPDVGDLAIDLQQTTSTEGFPQRGMRLNWGTTPVAFIGAKDRSAGGSPDYVFFIESLSRSCELRSSRSVNFIVNRQYTGATPFSVDFGNQGLQIAEFECDVLPWNDNKFSCGASSQRWTRVWASNGTIGTSDERHKQDIRPLDPDEMSRLAMAITPIEYRFKGNPSELRLGFGAQSFLDALKKCGMSDDLQIVNRENPDCYGMENDQIIPILAAALQQQQRRIDDLESKLAAMDDMLAALEAKLG